MTLAISRFYSSPPRTLGSRACPWHEQGAAVEALEHCIPAFAQGGPGKLLRRQREKNPHPSLVLAGLDPAIHALDWSKQRRGYAGRARARRCEIVSREFDTSQPCRKI